MRKSSLFLTVVLVLAVIVSFNRCTKKFNGVDNDMVIETPFSLYFSDTAGAIYNTNDGKTVKVIVKPDGFPCLALCTANNNLFYIKNSLYISTDNGANFNHTFDSLFTLPFTGCSNYHGNLNQTMIINVPDWNTIFTTNGDADPQNYLGIVLNLYQGARGYWWGDIHDTAVPPATSGDFGNYGPPGSAYGINVTTFTLLANGVLCGYDPIHNRNLYRTKNTLWKEATGNPDSATTPGIGVPGHYAGTPLPASVSTVYSYGHINNRLIAIDTKDSTCLRDDAFYSDDTGRTWIQYHGLPGASLLCVASPFEQATYIGTYKHGLYKLNTQTGTWQQQLNNGIAANTTVRNISFRENIYKNGKHVQYVFLATDRGLYMSSDLGANWTLAVAGNYTCVY